MVVYIAGPMSNVEGFNREAFFEAERWLRSLGYKVLNPAVLPVDLPKKAYMPICMAMLAQCDRILLLPGSSDSKGAILEAAFAAYQGIPILAMDEELGNGSD